MIYILGFCALVAIFATFPRTAILGVLLLGGGLYWAITKESEPAVQPTSAVEEKCSEAKVQKLGYRDCAEQEEWVNRILHRHDHK